MQQFRKYIPLEDVSPIKNATNGKNTKIVSYQQKKLCRSIKNSSKIVSMVLRVKSILVWFNTAIVMS